jgi:hypothetical protein
VKIKKIIKKELEDDHEVFMSSFNLDLETHISCSQSVDEEYLKQIRHAE